MHWHKRLGYFTGECHIDCPFTRYTSAMAGSIQARVRASLHASLQSEIHWEMRDCLMAGFSLSPSAFLQAMLASDLTKVCFGEMFGTEVSVLLFNSEQLPSCCCGKSGFEPRAMLWARTHTLLSHTLPCCLINLPSTNALLLPPERVEKLFWCP